MNTPVFIDVLFQDKPDIDPDINDILMIVSIGPDINAMGGTSAQGGTIIIDDNGTPNNPGDDFVFYTPPTGLSLIHI